jgi:tight adherence protein B
VTALAALLGLGVGLGVWLIVRGWSMPARTAGAQRRTHAGLDHRLLLRALVACGVGVMVGLVTGWVVGAVLAGLATFVLPRVLGPDREHAARVARFEAIASWAEMLRDTLSSAAGLEQAILVTAPLVPDPIREPVMAAASRLRSGQRLPPVLRELAEDLGDPTADLVISALVLAAERRASNLGELLGSLAQAARDHAALRMSVAAGRAQTRSEVRITIATTLGFAAGLLIFDRRYLNAYNAASGQVVLLIVGVLFGLGFWALTRIARVQEPARLLRLTDPVHTPTDTSTAGARASSVLSGTSSS